MKKMITLMSCVALSCTSFAQTFQWDTNDTIAVNLSPNTTEQYPMYQSAIGQDTVVLAIEIIYNDLPAAWDGMVCIYGTCLGTIPPVGTQATMSPISGTTQGMVRLTVNPFEGTEVAKLQVYVYDVNFPNDGDTATFLLNQTLGLSQTAVLDPVRIAPNPTNDVFSIDVFDGAEALRIVDMNGRTLRQMNLTSTGKMLVNVADLPTGIYTVQLSSQEGISSTRLIKQ